MQDIEATRQTLDEWLNAINIVHDRRRQEIENATDKCRSGDEKGLDIYILLIVKFNVLF